MRPEHLETRPLQYLSEIKRFVEILIASKKFHLLTIMGAPGWAKTHTTRKVLEELNAKYSCLGSYSTPLGLYNHLASAPNNVCVIDDTAGLFHNAQAMSLLNAASWPGAEGDSRRCLRWTSTSDLASTSSFEFNGKIVVLTNFMPETPQVRAFVNRSLHYKIQLDADIISQLLIDAADDKDFFDDTVLAKEVAVFLSTNAQYHDINRISLRTLEMGYELAKLNPDDWQNLLIKTLPSVPAEDVVKELDLSPLRIERQYEEFHRITGKSRRTFFYIRDRLGISKSSGTTTSTSAPNTLSLRSTEEPPSEQHPTAMVPTSISEANRSENIC